MRYLIDNRDTRDPYVNLALEEYCLKRLDTGHDYLLLYRNQPSVIVGRNQNVWHEVDRGFVQKNSIPVVRRMSGGGAVYHDGGNLNFCFIENQAPGGLRNLQRYLLPVVRALEQAGVQPVMNDRGDLLVGKHKISGNARFSNTRRILVHGTLLFDTDLEILARALQSPSVRLVTKATSSVRHSVVNIRSLLDRPMDLIGFQQHLIASLGMQMGGIRKQSLDEGQWTQIHRLAARKYRSWDWTFGRTPDFSISKNGRSRQHLQVDVHRGKITGISGQGAGSGGFFQRALQSRLNGVRYDREEILRALDGIELTAAGRMWGPEQLAGEIWFH